ncbi:MAG: hypothetical protein LUE17_15295 [Planctomycetaceae bacterium]|nr:hypothetical protein [Planctomycetaceae bacterium]
MPEAAADPTGKNPAPVDTHAAGRVDTGDFAALAEAEEAAAQAAAETEAGPEAPPEEAAADLPPLPDDAEPPPAPKGPSFIIRSLRWLIRYHPLLFLGGALAMAGYAWWVYPEPESRKVPPAESFYYDGLDRIYRVINPDLPLVADAPADEALAARNAFLNLFVFHRETLRDYPQFINPHLLLAEANRILAEFNPNMANRYWADAQAAYGDAAAWEGRDDDPARMAAYIAWNFLGGVVDPALVDPTDDEVVLRRSRRNDYIAYRQAEADVNLGRPELARQVLEDLRRAEDSRRREELRLSAQEESVGGDVPRRAFELGPDEYRDLDLLLARTYDGLGQAATARSWYLRYLAAVPGGRNHAFVVERLADIAYADGEVYRRVNGEQAAEHYGAAANYYTDLMNSPSATRRQIDSAILGLARTNSRLASLVPEGELAGVDELGEAGRTLRRWLEEFSGQPLPRRTLSLPLAVGETLSKPENILPGGTVLPGVVGGNLSAMAGGLMATPHERRRLYLTEALVNYDRIAVQRRGTEEGEQAAVAAARESWNLGLKEETESRLERMIDDLSSPDLILAARPGLAKVALDRGELRRAHMLILGGYAHPMPLWFTETDADWQKLAVLLGNAANREPRGVWHRLWEVLPEEGREIVNYAASGRRLDETYISRLLRALNAVLRRPDFYVPEDFPPNDRNAYLAYILDRNPELLTEEDVVWRNRLLLEEAWPYDLARRAARDNIGFQPFPPARELTPGGLVDPAEVRDVLVAIAAGWSRAGHAATELSERLRMITESNVAYTAALDNYGGDPGEILYELAHNDETLAEIREIQGDHLEALSLTARAARSYTGVSLRARGSPREMESLLAAGDAFFRAGLLERTVESQQRFLDRFGYNAQPGSESALAVVRAENLLGRAYWFLGDSARALEAFRHNIPRRTPDRFKSMYYIGRVLMEEGEALNRPELLGSLADPLSALDRNGDPIIETALQAFNHIRQSPGINPTARAWRWATFDLAKLRHLYAQNARRTWQEAQAAAQAAAPAGEGVQAEGERDWLALYDAARLSLTEALERYPLSRGGGGTGISVRVEPEDYADTMAARFESEYLLTNTLLILADAREDEGLGALARAHLENMRDRNRYADALFDPELDRFQLNAAIIREEVEGGTWDRSTPLPRTRLGDDEGPTHNPQILSEMLRNSMRLLGNEYFRAGEAARARQLLATTDPSVGAVASDAAGGYYQDSYRIWQDVYDRFGLVYGPEAMVNMGDNLNRLGYPEDARNHYRMARNMADLLPAENPEGVLLDIGPSFWGDTATQRLRDMDDGYTVP